MTRKVKRKCSSLYSIVFVPLDSRGCLVLFEKISIVLLRITNISENERLSVGDSVTQLTEWIEQNFLNTLMAISSEDFLRFIWGNEMRESSVGPDLFNSLRKKHQHWFNSKVVRVPSSIPSKVICSITCYLLLVTTDELRDRFAFSQCIDFDCSAVGEREWWKGFFGRSARHSDGEEETSLEWISSTDFLWTVSNDNRIERESFLSFFDVDKSLRFLIISLFLFDDEECAEDSGGDRRRNVVAVHWLWRWAWIPIIDQSVDHRCCHYPLFQRRQRSRTGGKFRGILSKRILDIDIN